MTTLIYRKGQYLVNSSPFHFSGSMGFYRVINLYLYPDKHKNKTLFFYLSLLIYMYMYILIHSAETTTTPPAATETSTTVTTPQSTTRESGTCTVIKEYMKENIILDDQKACVLNMNKNCSILSCYVSSIIHSYIRKLFKLFIVYVLYIF